MSELPTFPQALTDLDTRKRGEAWARKALDGEAASVVGAMNGTRNAALNRAAFSLGCIVAGGYLTEHEVHTVLTDAAVRSGLMQEDGPEAVAATITSGVAAGRAHPRHPQDRPIYPVHPMAPHAGAASAIEGKRRASVFKSAASFKGKEVKPRDWLVPDMVPMHTVTLFSGDGGTGKSLLALQLAVAVTSGAAWIGRSARGGRAIFMSAEDDEDELHRRLHDVLRAEGRTWDDLDGLTYRSLAGEDALLAVESHVQLVKSELFRELEARAEDDKPALVVIDTLADVYPANENDRAKVRQFIGILRSLAIKHRCAVILLGHPSLTGLNSGSGTSGSTAWNNSVRSRLYLQRVVDGDYEADPDARVLTTKKANYGRTGGEIALTWKDGVFVPQATPSGLDRMAATAKAERVFLKILDTLTAQGRHVSANPGPTYAPSVFAKHPDAEGMRKTAFTGAMESLLTRGDIVVATHGTGAKARSHIEKAGTSHSHD